MRYVEKDFDILMIFCIKYVVVISELAWFNKHVYIYVYIVTDIPIDRDI